MGARQALARGLPRAPFGVRANMKPETKKWTEVELAAEVIRWLQDEGWTVYQEVEVYQGGERADIVAVKGSVVSVIECKLTLTLDLIAQAEHWLGWAHMVSVATPRFMGRSRARRCGVKLLTMLGIGQITVDEPWSVIEGECRVRVSRKAKRRRKLPHVETLRGVLCPEHQTFAAAGNAKGKRWSAYQASVAKVVALLAEDPGLDARAIVKCLGKMHWASEAGARRGVEEAAARGAFTLAGMLPAQPS